MQRVTMFAGMVLVMCMMAVSANAQIIADVTVNYPVPTGDFADTMDPGFGAGADVFVSLPLLPLKLGGHVGYEKFAEKVDGAGDMTTIEILPSIRYQFGLPLVSFWAQFGAGMYRWKTDAADDTDFGLSAGAGVSAMIAPSLRVVAMPMYHIVMTDGDNLTYISANVGIEF